MNLEELKYIWQEHTETESRTRQVPIDDLRAMLHIRSQSALSKINRNILLDMGAFSVMMLIGGFVLLRNSNRTEWWEIALTVMLVTAAGLFYWKKYQSLNRASISTDNLKDSLISVTQTLDFYMKVYFYMIVLVVPVLGSGGILYGFYKGGQDAGRNLSDVPAEVWGIVLVTSLVYSALAVLASRWYVHRMFGIHHEELKACLNELSE